MINQIKKTIETYVDGYLNAEKGLVTETFYHETKLYSVEEGKIDKTEMKDWINNLEDRKTKGDIRKAKLEFGLIDITEKTAVVKIILKFEKRSFTDYLSLLYIEGVWIIVGKIYSIEELIT